MTVVVGVCQMEHHTKIRRQDLSAKWGESTPIVEEADEGKIADHSRMVNQYSKYKQ
jgi:hypothetical protein